MQSDYYRHGFDAMINFDYQDQAAKAATCMANIDLTWQQMADKLQSFNVLSYLSSHDTRLFREGGTTAAELLLLAPGVVQIFYGDESSRPFGPTGSDPLQVYPLGDELAGCQRQGGPQRYPLAEDRPVPRSPSGNRHGQTDNAVDATWLRVRA